MKTAVFYDIENIGLTKNNIDEIISSIKTSPYAEKIFIQNCYAVNKEKWSPEFLELLKKKKINMVDVKLQTTKNGKKKPNQTDLKMYSDIMKLVTKHRSIETVALVTGDGDFRFLLDTLKELGKNIILVTCGTSRASVLTDYCDDWIDLQGNYKIYDCIIEKWYNEVKNNNYTQMDSLLAVRKFIYDSAAIPLIHRLITNKIIDTNILLRIFSKIHRRINNQRLGFNTWTGLLSHVLVGTDFEITELTEYVKILSIIEDKTIIAPEKYNPEALYKNVLHSDQKMYSKKKMIKWINRLSKYSDKQLLEFIYYSKLMLDNNLIQNNELIANEDNYSDLLIAALKRKMSESGCSCDEAILKKLKEDL